MTRDESLKAFCATEVMGWHHGHFGYGGCWYGANEEFKDGPHWNPAENGSDMMQLWERAVEKFSIRLTSPFSPGDKWHGGVTPAGVTGWNGRPDWQASAASGPRAITEAIAKAYGWKEPQNG